MYSEMSIFISTKKIIGDYQTIKYIFENFKKEKKKDDSKFFIRCDMNPIYLPLQSNILLNTGIDIFCNELVDLNEDLIGLDKEFDEIWKYSTEIEKMSVREYINQNLSSNKPFFSTFRVKKYNDSIYFVDKAEKSNVRVVIKFDNNNIKNYFEKKYSKLPIINIKNINENKPVIILPNVWDFEKKCISSPLNTFIKDFELDKKNLEISYNIFKCILNFGMYIPTDCDKIMIHLLWPLFSNPVSLMDRLQTDPNLVSYFFIEKEIYLKRFKEKVTHYLTEEGLIGRDCRDFNETGKLVEKGECICSRCFIKNDDGIYKDVIIYCLYRIRLRTEDADKNAEALIEEEKYEKEVIIRKEILKNIKKKKVEFLAKNKNLAKKIATEAKNYYERMMSEKSKKIILEKKKKIIAKKIAEEAKIYLNEKRLKKDIFSIEIPVLDYSSSDEFNSEKSTPLLNFEENKFSNKIENNIWLFNLWN